MSSGFSRPLMWWVAAVGIALVSVMIRWLALGASGSILVTGDEDYYFQTALHLAMGGGHEYPLRGAKAEWPPGYPFFLALFMDLRANGLDAEALSRSLVVAQLWLGGALVLLCGCLGRKLLGPVVGLVAAVGAAIYPDLIVFSHYLFSETLFTVLLLAALLAVVHYEQQRRLGAALVAGVLFGLAALTREVAVLLAVACVLWWILRAKPGKRGLAFGHGAVLGAVLVCVVLPWTVRNYSVFDRVVLVSNAAWLNARSGNTLVEPGWLRPSGGALESFRSTYFSIPDELARADYARSQSLALIREEQPSWLFKKTVRTVLLLGSPDSYLFKKISRGAYPELSIRGVRTLLIVGVASYLAIVLLSLPGWAAARGQEGRALALLLVATTFSVHVLANASPRYRFPLMPLAIIFAASTVVSPRRVLLSLGKAEWVAVGAAAVILLGGTLPYFWPEAVSLWQHGTYMEPNRP